MAVNIDEILEYYKNLLIIQYNNKPKAKAEIESFTKKMLADGLIFKVQDAFNIDDAVGVQLDILGKYIGIDRFFTGQQLLGEGYFQLIPYSDIPYTPAGDEKGFTDYSNYDTADGKFLNYNSFISNNLKLDDDDYRFLLKLKIVQNNIDHTNKSIVDNLYKFFSTDLFCMDNQDMSMTYFVKPASLELVKIALEKEVLPKPMGVDINSLIVRDENIFYFTSYEEDTISDLKSGFSTYSDYDTKTGEFLKYENIISV